MCWHRLSGREGCGYASPVPKAFGFISSGEFVSEGESVRKEDLPEESAFPAEMGDVNSTFSCRSVIP